MTPANELISYKTETTPLANGLCEWQTQRIRIRRIQRWR